MNPNLLFRRATKDDLPDVIRMLADDVLGALREKQNDTLSDGYMNAFETIDADPSQELTVAELNGEIVATFQLTYIQYLTYKGGLRAQLRL